MGPRRFMAATHVRGHLSGPWIATVTRTGRSRFGLVTTKMRACGTDFSRIKFRANVKIPPVFVAQGSARIRAARTARRRAISEKTETSGSSHGASVTLLRRTTPPVNTSHGARTSRNRSAENSATAGS
jgi:hypothetical protein